MSFGVVVLTGSEGVVVVVVVVSEVAVFSGFALAESLLLDFLFFVSAFFTSSFTSSTLSLAAAETSWVTAADSASVSCVFWAGSCYSDTTTSATSSFSS